MVEHSLMYKVRDPWFQWHFCREVVTDSLISKSNSGRWQRVHHGKDSSRRWSTSSKSRRGPSLCRSCTPLQVECGISQEPIKADRWATYSVSWLCWWQNWSHLTSGQVSLIRLDHNQPELFLEVYQLRWCPWLSSRNTGRIEAAWLGVIFNIQQQCFAFIIFCEQLYQVYMNICSRII